MIWTEILIGVLLVVIIIQAEHIYELRVTFRRLVKHLEHIKAMLEGYSLAKKVEGEEEKN
ncbi:MAG: hypothetical protein LUC16_02195 [Coprobacillus sp.]|nr:hypothetical protein [Coprobacillus sp.]